MKSMKYRLVLLTLVFLVLQSGQIQAQLNVGSADVPHSSAALQISPTNKGLRLPQVSLSATYTYGLNGTPSAVTTGMEVYNTNAGIAGSTAYPAYGAGIYVWDGNGWYKNVAKTITQTLNGPIVSAGFGPSDHGNASYSPLPFYSSVISNDSNYVKIDSASRIVFQKAGYYKIAVALDVAHTFPGNTNGQGFYNFYLMKDVSPPVFVASNQVSVPAVASGTFTINRQISLSSAITVAAQDTFLFGVNAIGLDSSETANPVYYFIESVTVTLLRLN